MNGKEDIVWISAFHYRLLLLLVKFEHALLLDMLSMRQTSIVDPGATVRFECEFEYEEFYLFDNPIVWRKSQHGEDSQVNMMGNLVEPFASARRFKASFHQAQAPRYLFSLAITDVVLEDSGNYTCEVGAPQNVVLGAVTPYLMVRASVGHVFFGQKTAANIRNSTSSSHSGLDRSSFIPPTPYGTSPVVDLVFTEHQPSTLHCTALGGYPPPELAIYVGQRNVGRDFNSSRSWSMSGRRGLRLVYYTTERWTNMYRVVPDDDGLLVKCAAAVPGLVSNITVARINVQYSAAITCENSSAALGDRNVCIRCEVKAKPAASALYWIIDDNGTTVTEGQVVDEHWTLVMERTDGVVDIQLYFRHVEQESFRTYTLVAENGVAIRRKNVTLFQKHRTVHKSAASVKPKSVQASRQESSKRDSSYRSTADGQLRTALDHLLVICLITSVFCCTLR